MLPTPSSSHIVLIPSYNPGEQLRATVIQACEQWNPVWVVVDGSTDNSLATLRELQQSYPSLYVLALAENQGKGAAVLHGISEAQKRGYTHVLTMDSDGQHPAHLIPAMMVTSQNRPEAMVLGKPVFDASAPKLRVNGRKVSNFWAQLETLWAGIGDSLYGFRVYPIAPLQRIMQQQRWMRRFDFDPEAVVRLSWAGVPAINLDAPVTYYNASEGGVSHFKYLRDNTLLTWMHTRLMFGFAARLPALLWRKFSTSRH